MLNEIVNRLQGQVHIRAESVFPERVLNLCGARDLAFWDVRWESPTAFTCRLSRRDWHRLRQAAKNLDCSLTVIHREGAPYFLFRFRRRQALLAGLLACCLGLFLGSFFIWDFAVEGNETVPTEEILRSLEKNGVKPLVPYGFGLSYTTFDISDPKAAVEGDCLKVTARVKNTGDRDGDEVVQLYVGFQNSAVDRPVKQLRGFSRVSLKAGEEKTVEIVTPVEKLKWYNPVYREWQLEHMDYPVYVGSSSAQEDLHRDGDQPVGRQ